MMSSKERKSFYRLFDLTDTLTQMHRHKKNLSFFLYTAVCLEMCIAILLY